jgi:hypothetical protein
MTMIDEYAYIPLNNKKLIFGDRQRVQHSSAIKDVLQNRQ